MRAQLKSIFDLKALVSETVVYSVRDFLAIVATATTNSLITVKMTLPQSIKLQEPLLREWTVIKLRCTKFFFFYCTQHFLMLPNTKYTVESDLLCVR